MAKKRKQRSTAPATTEPSIPESQMQDHSPEQADLQQQEQEQEQKLEQEQGENDLGQDEEEQASEEPEEQPNDVALPNQESNGGAQNGGTDEVEVSLEENDAVLKDEPLEKILEPFGKDQLVVLLKKAVDKHPDLMESVLEIADADPAHRKIFVHGLGWDATADTLKEVFGKYGEIEDCKAVTDRVSGKSKGYAFILYKHRVSARKALQEPQKTIGSRMTSCQLASTGPVPAPPPTSSPVSEYTQRKIFVSNVSADVEPEKLLEFFKQFGEIEEGPLGLDRQTGKPKGFALFVYKSVESAKKALEQPHKNFEGVTLHCQRAIDGPRFNKQNYGGHIAGGGGHHSQQHHPHHHPAKKGKYSSGGGVSGHGHLMAPSGASASFNPGVGGQGLNPMLGQALTALIATQGGNLGIGNMMGGIGGAPVNQGLPGMGYGAQPGGVYGTQAGMQGGYGSQGMNPQIGQGGSGRSYQGGAPYMGQ